MFALSLAGITFGQKVKEETVPSPVKAAFDKQYPDAKEVSWEKENAGYEVGFQWKGSDYSVLYDASGKVIETEVEIKVSELPAASIEYVKNKYPGSKIMEAAKITGADGTVTFEAEVKGMDLIFDSNGTFIKSNKD